MTIVLKKGDITKHGGDVIINVLPNSAQLIHGGGVCKSILKCGGSTVQQEIDNFKKDVNIFPAGTAFYTSAGSISNVKYLLHFVQSHAQVSALQWDIENCLRWSQSDSLYSILIPAIGTAGMGISPRNSAEIILNAAGNLSMTSNHHTTLTIVIYQEEMLPCFKMVLEEKMKTFPKLLSEENNLGTSTFILSFFRTLFYNLLLCGEKSG